MTVASEVFGQSVTCGSCQKSFVAVVADPPDDIIPPETKAEMDAAWTWFVYRQSLYRSLRLAMGFWILTVVLCICNLPSSVAESASFNQNSSIVLWCESTLVALAVIGYQEKKSWTGFLAGGLVSLVCLIVPVILCCNRIHWDIGWGSVVLVSLAPFVVSFFPPRKDPDIENAETKMSEYRQSLSNSLYLSVGIVFFTTLFGYFIILCTGAVNTEAERWGSLMLALWCGSMLAAAIVGHAKKRLLLGILSGMFSPWLSLFGTAFIIRVLPLPDVSPAVADIGVVILMVAAPLIMSFLPPRKSNLLNRE